MLAFPLRETKDREEVREIGSRIMQRTYAALLELGNNHGGAATKGGDWCIMMMAEPFIQGGGMEVKDAGPRRSIKTRQRFIVGFILQYLGG